MTGATEGGEGWTVIGTTEEREGSGLLPDAGLLLVLGDWRWLTGCGEAHMEDTLAPQQLSCSFCDAPVPREDHSLRN